MAKVTYILTPGSDLKRIQFDAEGKMELVFETNCYDDNNFETDEQSGEKQSDMLWELFDHSFEVTDEDGNVIEYDDSGYRT